MFILKISDTSMPSATETNLIPGNYDSESRKIDFRGFKDLSSSGAMAGFIWRIEPTLVDNITKRPKKEIITTTDGKEIECIVFKISYIGTATQGNGMIDKEFYLRIYDANITISKVFLAIVEESILKVAKIEFVKTKNAPEIDNAEKFIINDKEPALASIPQNNILNKSYLINKDFNQITVALLKILTNTTNTDKPSYFILRNYYKNSDVSSDYDISTNEPSLTTNDFQSEDNTANSKPTFQDFISIYQDLLYSDPEAEAQKWQDLIDKELALQVKYKSALDEFKKYIKNFNENLNLHTTKVENISSK
jgi:hypothetical protein